MADLTIKLSNGRYVEVKIDKVKPIGGKEPIVIEKNELGEVIQKKRKTDTGVVFDSFKWINIDNNGKEYTPTKVIKYEVTDDGKEIPISFPPKTRMIEFSMDSVLPITYLGRLLPESQYEVYTTEVEGIKSLCEEVDKAIEKDVAYYVSPFCWKADTKKQYFAIFVPYRTEDNKFGFTMMTSEGKIELHHAMEIPLDIEKKEIKVLQKFGNLASLLEVK